MRLRAELPKTIGVIGAGEMGSRVAKEFGALGHRVICFDTDRRKLEACLRDGNNITIAASGNEVTAKSDIQFYLIPTEDIENAVKEFGGATKKGAIVSAGTSVMLPAERALRTHLSWKRDEISIINWHWLCSGTPSVDLRMQSSVVVRVVGRKSAYEMAKSVFREIGMGIIEMPSSDAHDKMMADIQAVTHIGFYAIGSTWSRTGFFPWEKGMRAGNLDRVKILLMLRILGGESHVYGGLAIINEHAVAQIKEYAAAVNDLFELIKSRNESSLRKTVFEAKEFLFSGDRKGIILSDEVLRSASIGLEEYHSHKPNSHISLLAMGVAWKRLGIKPQDNLICGTPQFKLRFAIVEALFRDEALLEESIQAAIRLPDIAIVDSYFNDSVREWTEIIERRDLKAFKRLFEETGAFFGRKRLDEAIRKSDELIARLVRA